jgi:hypothetical protein
MLVPNINRTEAQSAMELAEELMIPYKEDLEHQTLQLEFSKKELSAAQALVSIIKRSEIRSKVLKDCAEFGSCYTSKLDDGDLQRCEQFVSTLEYRVMAFSRRIDRCNEAIDLLNNDISDLKKILDTPFGNMYVYLACIGDGPGWAFFTYKPEKWLARWTRSLRSKV